MTVYSNNIQRNNQTKNKGFKKNKRKEQLFFHTMWKLDVETIETKGTETQRKFQPENVYPLPQLEQKKTKLQQKAINRRRPSVFIACWI